MRERYKNALMWGLYAALVLLILVLQTVSFGRPRFFGVKLCFVPVLVACVSMHVGSEAGCVFGMVCGLLWDYTAGRTVGMLALEMMLLCFAVGVLVQLYLQSAPGNFAVISAAAALLVLSCDWLFFYRMPGYNGSAQRYLWFVLPSAALTIPASLVEFAIVRHIYNKFKIDNGVV